MCADILPVLFLYRNVKITRDYSVTHDLTPAQWHNYLQNLNNEQSGDTSPPVKVFEQSVNYYRLPDVIRIEGKYDEIRKATYGELLYIEGPDIHRYFFWVDAVRLVKLSSTETAPRLDVVELQVANDIWSNKFTDCQLYDSYIVRRHEDRWYRDHTDPDDPSAWVYHPRYFPNAADPVGGAYATEGTPQDLTEPVDLTNTLGYKVDVRFIVIGVVSTSGITKYYVIPDLIRTDTKEHVKIYAGSYSRPYYTFEDILAGNIFGGSWALTVANVQSITVVPCIDAIKNKIIVAPAYGADPAYIYLYATGIGEFAKNFDENYTTGGNNTSGAMLVTKGNADNYMKTFLGVHTTTVDPKKPALTDPSTEISYSDFHEPMLFRAPARVRKVTSAMGGTITDVPDIDAFEDTYTVQNIFELDSSSSMIYGGTDLEAANAKGNVGVVTNASLPIYNSAWKEYQAIQKAGDDIAFNAQQVSTIVGTVTGAAGGLAGGAISGAMTTGNPAGAVGGAAIGAVGGIIGGATRYWANSENLRAKRETIKNTPCTVKSGGSGFTGFCMQYIDDHFTVLKLDDVSFNKLRTQYYYYGYNVNMVIPGAISTNNRVYFDYIETDGANIRGDVNAEEAQQIANIFDRGVRIYHGYSGYQLIGRGMSRANTESSFMS